MSKKKNIVVAKDFGEIHVPTSWDDITLEQFTKLVRMRDEKQDDEELDMVDIMAVLIDRDKSFIYSLPNEFVNTIMAHLLFLNEPLDETPKQMVQYNGETYSINYMEELKFGEYVDSNTCMQNDKYDYATLLAILCRKDGEEYNDDFIAHELDKRIEMYNHMPIPQAYKLVNFFLTLHLISEKHLEHYLETTEDQLNQLVKNIKDSVRGGDGTKLSLTSRMKVWWKCKKLERLMRQLHSNTSVI